MRYSKLSLLIPCALLLSACTTVTPAYKDNGPRIGACVEGGPDSVAQQFYDYRIQHHSNDIAALRPYLSDNWREIVNRRQPRYGAPPVDERRSVLQPRYAAG